MIAVVKKDGIEVIIHWQLNVFQFNKDMKLDKQTEDYDQFELSYLESNPES